MLYTNQSETTTSLESLLTSLNSLLSLSNSSSGIGDDDQPGVPADQP